LDIDVYRPPLRGSSSRDKEEIKGEMVLPPARADAGAAWTLTAVARLLFEGRRRSLEMVMLPRPAARQAL
jgi:hypothetical protein